MVCSSEILGQLCLPLQSGMFFFLFSAEVLAFLCWVSLMSIVSESLPSLCFGAFPELSRLIDNLLCTILRSLPLVLLLKLVIKI